MDGRRSDSGTLATGQTEKTIKTLYRFLTMMESLVVDLGVTPSLLTLPITSGEL